MSDDRIRSGEPLSFCLSVWVIYDKPKDFPGMFVARRHVAADCETRPTSEFFTSETLDGVRSYVKRMNPNLVRRPRDEGDDPTIVETWL